MPHGVCKDARPCPGPAVISAVWVPGGAPHAALSSTGGCLIPLVTGYNGFVGRHFLQSGPATVFADEAGRIDLRDESRMELFFACQVPDAVVHLAGMSSAVDSGDDERGVYETNLLGTLNLLRALKACGFRGRFLYVSSSEVYGVVPDARLPVSEDAPVCPGNPYATSRAAAELLCRQWARSAPFEIVIARPFNHTGPGQSSRFLASALTRQAAEMRLGLRQAPLVVGNLHVTRDFLDVRDVVAAYRLLLQRGCSGETYNIASGVEWPLQKVLDLILAQAGIETPVAVDPRRVRAGEALRMVGDATRLRRATGWSARHTLAETLGDMLNDWDRRLRAERSR